MNGQKLKKLLLHFKKSWGKAICPYTWRFSSGYEPQPYDVIRALVFEYASMGTNILQNFSTALMMHHVFPVLLKLQKPKMQVMIF